MDGFTAFLNPHPPCSYLFVFNTLDIRFYALLDSPVKKHTASPLGGYPGAVCGSKLIREIGNAHDYSSR